MISKLKVLNKIYTDELKILQVKSDAIVWNVSTDGLCIEKLGTLLINLYPDIKVMYLNGCLNEVLTSGRFLYYNSVNPPIIIVPFKDSVLGGYKDSFILDFVLKMNEVKDKLNIKTISIEKSRLSESQIKLIKDNKKFKVKIFNKEKFLQEI